LIAELCHRQAEADHPAIRVGIERSATMLPSRRPNCGVTSSSTRMPVRAVNPAAAPAPVHRTVADAAGTTECGPPWSTGRRATRFPQTVSGPALIGLTREKLVSYLTEQLQKKN
jgi:hypothetical protein